ncbi:hypothetical protein J2X36_003652 [Methylobacterium sp. BE186]|uniref:hypothetical protein n=1 Tax=Methylobacterium sp. BE186 TaxID=2817715 RepID=UPI002856DB96|nr:hypothetical protein [Methylobacterium sp. BE186]MDR7038880.1 hypothetical protein [Methylobacterium sp. BE186]
MPHSRRCLRPRAGGAATGLFLGGLLVAATAAIAVPAKAQSVESRRDQPNASTLPADFPTVKSGERGADQRVGGVAPPSAIRSTTAVVPASGGGKAAVTNPLDHLPKSDRVGLSGRRE